MNISTTPETMFPVPIYLLDHLRRQGDGTHVKGRHCRKNWVDQYKPSM